MKHNQPSRAIVNCDAMLSIQSFFQRYLPTVYTTALNADASAISALVVGNYQSGDSDKLVVTDVVDSILEKIIDDCDLMAMSDFQTYGVSEVQWTLQTAMLYGPALFDLLTQTVAIIHSELAQLQIRYGASCIEWFSGIDTTAFVVTLKYSHSPAYR